MDEGRGRKRRWGAERLRGGGGGGRGEGLDVKIS